MCHINLVKTQIDRIRMSFVQMVQRLERTAMSACSAPKTSPRSKPFVTYGKDVLLQSTKKTVTEL